MISTAQPGTDSCSNVAKKLQFELESVDLVGGQNGLDESHFSFGDWEKTSCAASCAETCAETHSYTSSYFDSSFTSSPDTVDETKKRVRFAVSDDGGMAVKVHPSEAVLSPQEVNALWWKSSDFRYFRKHSKKISVAAQKSPYLNDFKTFYDMCGALAIKKKDVRFFARICNTPARGLEVPTFDPIMTDRKLVISGVLKAQNKVMTDLGCDDNNKAKALAATSKYLTKHSRAMACAIGQGDAAIARAIHKETENSGASSNGVDDNNKR